MPSTYHTPVLLNEAIQLMNLTPDSVCVDATFGGGGHSREIVRQLTGRGRLYSFDQDADAERNAEGWDKEHFTFVRSNFRFLKNFLKFHGEEAGVDAILADLGVSSHHFDDSDRGFSFRFDSKLDMRMNQRARQTAADLLNNYTEEALADILYQYGELKNSRQIAAAIVKARTGKRIETTGDFLDIVQRFFQREREKKDMAKVFQALRIEVNHEMDALRDMLEAAVQVLKPGGRLVVITYHSLEDRMVKNLMKTGRVDGREEKDFYGRTNSPLIQVTRKPIIPTQDEQDRNPRSRSAKLRVAEKL